MITFKEFTKSKTTAVFMQAGGRKPKNLIGKSESPAAPTVYMSAGGPPPKKHIQESSEPQSVTLKGPVLVDPSQDNTGVGSKTNDHEHLIKAPTHSGFSGRTYPNLTNQQSHHYKSLAAITNNLHPDYQSHVENYTEDSSDLNSHLYNSHIMRSEPKPEVDGMKIKALDNLIAQHKTPHDMVVYSGPHFNPKDHAGQEVDAPAYTSTSLTPHVAKEFGVGQHILRIHVPAGHPHLFMDHESCFQGQSEVVLPRGMKFRIADKPSHIVTGKFKEHYGDARSTYPETHYFWDAHIVPKNH